MHLPILPTILLGLTALGIPATAAETEVPFAAGTDHSGRARAVSDAEGRVMIESPEFPRGLWVDLTDEAGQALAGIQVEYQGRADSLVVIWSVDPSGLRQETLLWTRTDGDALRLTLQAADPADLPPGLASIDWRIDPGAEELLVLEEGPDLIGWEAVTAFLQERWQGRTGRVAVQIDSSTAITVDLDHAAPANRLVEYLKDRTRSSLGEGIASLVQVLLTPHTFDRDLALLEDSIVLTTSLALVPGSKLEEWVLPELSRSGGPVTWSEASALKELYLRGKQIVDVRPLAALTGLEWLDLGRNEIDDVSPLAVLTKLKELYLWYNQIVHVSPLSSLGSLENLYLDGNEIVDVSSLASLPRLKELGLSENRIVHVRSLAALTNLVWLRLWSNEIVDVRPLARLTSLTSLELDSNEIVDVSPLTALANLERLSLGGNEIVEVRSLAALTSLEWLSLGGNGIVDVSPLAALTNLKWLSLGYNEIVDVSPLAALTSLKSLELHSNQIIRVRSLAALANLERLQLWGNEVVDMGPLAPLTNLKGLSLQRNGIVNVGPLATLTRLEWLELQDNEIVDVSPLAALTSLKSLVLWGNKIQDIGPLVANSGLGQGDKVDLRDNPLSARAVLEQIPALKTRGVEVTF